MATGECNCGAVSFEISCSVTDVYLCHCSICRKATGANGIAVVVVPNTEFRWLTGESHIKNWRKPAHDWQLNFCNCCGSPLPGPDSDTHTFIPAGLLSDSNEQLRVAHHIWVGSKAAWDEIGDAGQQHPESFAK